MPPSSSTARTSELAVPANHSPPAAPWARRRHFFFLPCFLGATAAAVAAATVAQILSFSLTSADPCVGSGGDAGGVPEKNQILSFDAPDGPSAPGIGHSHDHQQQQQFRQRERRPSCGESDDPEYTCLLARPPGSFRDEIVLYFTMSTEGVNATAGGDPQREGSLSVKIVVPPAGSRRGKGGDYGGETGWASLGFSPNGKMAGPSEGVVGFIGAAARDDIQGGEGVLRYRMDGYSVASIAPLPDRNQVLTDQVVETAADGSLVIRFRRPLLEPPPCVRDCLESAAAHEREGTGSVSATASAAATENQSAAVRDAVSAGQRDIAWLDPRQEGVVLLWAYGRGAWPSYHDATGAFLLPRF